MARKRASRSAGSKTVSRTLEAALAPIESMLRRVDADRRLAQESRWAGSETLARRYALRSPQACVIGAGRALSPGVQPALTMVLAAAGTTDAAAAATTNPSGPVRATRREPPRASVIGASVFGIKRHHHRPTNTDNSADIAASPVVVAAKPGTASRGSVAQSGPARPVPRDVASARAPQAFPDDPHRLDPLPGSVLAVVRAEAAAVARGSGGRAERQGYCRQARNAEAPSSGASRGVTAESGQQLSGIRCCHKRRT